MSTTLLKKTVLRSNALFPGRSRIEIEKPSQLLTGVTAATDTVTKTAHGLTVGSPLRYINGTGFTGLAADDIFYVVAAPTSSTFKVAETPGGAAITVGTSSDGSFQPIMGFEAPQLTDESPAPTFTQVEMPDDQGINRPVFRQPTAQPEGYTFVMVEALRLLEIFGGGLTGFFDANVRLTMPDPADASGTVRLRSERFPAQITRGGNVAFGGQQFSQPTIRIDSLKEGVIEFERDVTV